MYVDMNEPVTGHAEVLGAGARAPLALLLTGDLHEAEDLLQAN